MKKIDFVLPWVDGNDIEWQKRKKKFNPTIDKDSNADTRFRDMGTLRYVLRSIEKNFPEYNKIYLITEGHYPQWININHPKIELITHENLYFDKSHLPVFSSSSIEMNLANIKSLSDQFVYLNDDTIIIRPTKGERFFRDSLPVDFISHGWMSRNKMFEKIRGRDTWVHSLNNNLKLINYKLDFAQLNKKHLYHKTYHLRTKISNFLMKCFYKKFFWLEHWHHPQPYLKSTLMEAYSLFSQEMMNCSKNRFRADNDLTQYLYRYLHLVKGEFTPFYHKDGYVANIKSEIMLDGMIRAIESNENINFVCFNDDISLSDEEFGKVKTKLIDYLESKLFQKASFEL